MIHVVPTKFANSMLPSVVLVAIGVLPQGTALGQAAEPEQQPEQRTEQRAAQPQSPPMRFTNVTASFPSGPYLAVATDDQNPNRLAMSTEEGLVFWTENGGIEVQDSEGQHFRKLDAVTWRGEGGSKAILSGPDEAHNPESPFHNKKNYAGELPTMAERAQQLFLNHLMLTNTPPVRWMGWMGLQDKYPSITNLALPPDNGAMFFAGAGGIFRSDKSRLSWHQVLGPANSMPRDKDPVGLAVSVDPRDPSHVIASLDTGLFISNDGGRNFSRHKNPDLAEYYFTKIAWDATNPAVIFLVGSGQIMMSQDRGQTFEASFGVEGEINDICVTGGAILVSSSDGLYIAGGEGTQQEFAKKNVVGTVALTNTEFLVATETELWHITSSGHHVVFSTTSLDPFMKLAGHGDAVWIITRKSIFKLGDLDRQPAVKPPRMLLNIRQFEKTYEDNAAISQYNLTSLARKRLIHLIPTVDFTIDGNYPTNQHLVNDATINLPVRYGTFENNDRLHWEVMFSWEVNDLLFAGVINAANLIPSNVRDKRKELKDRARSMYRQTAELVKEMENPPQDPIIRMQWSWRLEELSSTLETLVGKKIVEIPKEEIQP